MENQIKNRRIALPPQVELLLARLRGGGYPAYVVGGCVRDSVLGRTPGDWDICTAANPWQIKQLFAGYRKILTGEKHGTVAVIIEGNTYEITTYRIDGRYADGRHPEAVLFVPELRQDLARRDFTINAMAYAPGEGIIDEFDGMGDLAARCVRSVGNPAARFGEDALRILRAVRFAAQLDFTLDPPTAAAALKLRETVACVSAERIFTELDKLLLAPAAGRILEEYGGILGGAVPEILPCIGCTQPGKWHCYDVWQHTAVAVRELKLAGQDERSARILRWAVFLHDMAKPACRVLDAGGSAHFYGHNQRGARLARSIFRRLKAPTYLENAACGLIAVHDMPLPEDDAGIMRMLGSYGQHFLQRLCRVKYADLDAHAKNAAVAARRKDVAVFERRMNALAQTGCYTVSQLRVNGADVMAHGVPAGPEVGRVLKSLLAQVMAGELENRRDALLDALDAM